ncbi:MAG: hypothetical protein WC384_11535 [Prolixibacteraceae bacterium]|jgi:hypothetical protein
MKLLPAFALFALFLLSKFYSSAQELNFAGSRHQGLAVAAVGLTDCWSVFGNQAGLSKITHPEFAGSFQNRFLVSELSTRTGLFVLPVLSSVFAVSLQQFGKIPFRQEKFGLAFARQISPHFSFGLQFNYYSLFLSEENHSVGSAGLEIGMQYYLNEQFTLGVHVLNPYQTSIKLRSGNFDYSQQINVGANYQLSDSFSFMTELQNDFENHFIVRTGMEYAVFEKLFLRAGFAGKPYQFSAGLGFQVRKLFIDLASSYNQYLGNSPSVSFQFQF